MSLASRFSANFLAASSPNFFATAALNLAPPNAKPPTINGIISEAVSLTTKSRINSVGFSAAAPIIALPTNIQLSEVPSPSSSA